MKKLLVGAIATMMLLSVVGCGAATKLELQKETFTVEYGETISTSAKDYLKKDSEKEVIKNTKITVKKLENEKDKEYPAIGTYDATAKYQEESKSFKIEVEDTTAPTFKDLKESIEVEVGYSGDYKEFFTAEDLSEVTLSVNSKKVDSAAAGEYELTVTATDTSDNKTKETVKVVVKEKATESTEETTTENNVPSGGTTNTTTSSGSTSSGSSTSGSSGGTSNVCVPGTPNPAEIGNSGLLLTPAQYDAFWDLWENDPDGFAAKYGGWWGFDAFTINFDTCGNPMTSIIWTINWTY